MNRRNFLENTAAVLVASQLPAESDESDDESDGDWGASPDCDSELSPAAITRRLAIGKRAKHTREWRKLSIADSALACGLTEQRLLDFEAGAVSLSAKELLEVVHGYNVQFHWLLTGEPLPANTYPACLHA